MIKKVISGGQTGADRIGLEVAKSLCIPTGGTAPKKFMTENGSDYSLKDKFGLSEITDSETEEWSKMMKRNDRYTARTCTNVKNSDGTVCFSSDKQSSGTLLTKRICESLGRPFIMNPNIDSLVEFIKTNNIEILNVAGNRASRMNKRDANNFRTILFEALKIVTK